MLGLKQNYLLSCVPYLWRELFSLLCMCEKQLLGRPSLTFTGPKMEKIQSLFNSGPLVQELISRLCRLIVGFCC